MTSDGTNWTSAAPAGGGGYYVVSYGGGGPQNPADSTTYWLNPYTSTITTTTQTISRRVYFPAAGTITAAYGANTVVGTLGTTENSTLTIRLNNTTDTPITSTLKWDAAETTFNNTGLSIAVVAGDYIEVKLVCPAWSTNPTNAAIAFSLVVTT